MPTIQRRVSPNGKIKYRALVRLKGHKPKTATFLKRADAVTWSQETETKIRQARYFPDRLIESEKYTLGDLLDRYKSEVLPRKRDKKQTGLIEWWRNELGDYKLGIFKAGVFGDSRGQVGFGEIGSKKKRRQCNRFVSYHNQPWRQSSCWLFYILP